MSPDPRPGRGKKPAAKSEPSPQKQASKAFDPDASPDSNLVWRLAGVDLDGTWGWKNLDLVDMPQLLSEMTAFERLPCHVLKINKQLVEMPLEHICEEAQRRLIEIEREDIDLISELRLADKRRAWGNLASGVFHLLWWDPNHTVCTQYPARGERRRKRR